VTVASVVSLVEAAAWLPVVLLAPTAWLLLRGLDRRRAARLFALVGPRVGVLGAERSERARGRRRLLFSAALGLALLAALRPSWGEATEGRSPGADVVVCLDVSRSMLARDGGDGGKTNGPFVDRLTRARGEIRALAERARGDRLALVVFAGEALVRAPLTEDAAAVAELADASDVDSVARGGTDLGAALDAGLGVLSAPAPSGDRSAAILLLTDGEDLAGRGADAARRCRERGVVVHCLGLGDPRGSKIAVPIEPASERSPLPRGESFLRDRAGSDVVSALDVLGLEAIARAGGGRFVDARDGGRSAVALYEEQIAPTARRSRERGALDGRENRFQWPLVAAIALWLLDLAFTDRRRR
jgi:Ca-activated chloride channel family protein